MHVFAIDILLFHKIYFRGSVIIHLYQSNINSQWS